MYILSALLHLLVVNARQYSIVKDRTANCKIVVGLGRIELPTSPLSGVRSSQLSYRPGWASEQNRAHKQADFSSKLVELVGIEPATS
jgi:hypothetical protein